MKYLVDTNVISETFKKHPDEHTMDWMERNASNVFLSTITLEELRFGERLMPSGMKRRELGMLIDDICRFYDSRFLGFDSLSAEKCAQFHAESIEKGFTPDIEDLMIAAIASTNNMAVATRNVKDFNYLDIETVNPFEA